MIKIFATTLLIITILTGIVAVSLDILDVEPSISSWVSTSDFAVTAANNTIRVMVHGSLSVQGSSSSILPEAYIYTLEVEYPDAHFIRTMNISRYSILECRLYVISDPIKVYNLKSLLDNTLKGAPIVEAEDYIYVVRGVESLADQTARFQPTKIYGVDTCKYNLDVKSLPRLVVLEVLVDGESFHVASRFYGQVTTVTPSGLVKYANPLKEINYTVLEEISSKGITEYTRKVLGEADAKLVSIFMEQIEETLSLAFSKPSILHFASLKASLKLDLGSVWRMASLIMLSVLLLAYDPSSRLGRMLRRAR